MKISGRDRAWGLRIHWRVGLAMVPPVLAGVPACLYGSVLWVGFGLCALFALGAMAAHRKFLIVLSLGMLFAVVDIAAATDADKNHPESGTPFQK
jgi:hypothetical protein